MPTALDLNCHAILLAASTAELGIVVTTNDVNKARGSLYRFRRELGDPSYAGIQIRVSPNDAMRELWLIRLPSANASVAQANIPDMNDVL